MNSKKKKIIIIFSIIIGFILLVAGSGLFYVNHMLSKIDRETLNKDPDSLGIKPGVKEKIEELQKKEKQEKSSEDKEENNDIGNKKIRNIALFGIDQEEGNAGRSDAIMILTIDEIHKKIKLSSIMRDSYVNIEGRGMDKINHAYAFGGAQLALKTINSNYDLNIEDFVTVNFTTLPKIIDTLGGVEITIKDYEVPLLRKVGIESAGTYNLTGKQALAYSRIRYVGNGDYERTERQRKVLDQVFSKLIKLNITEIPGVMAELLPMVKTNLTNGEILDLAQTVLGLGLSKLEQQRFPLDGYCNGKMLNGIWYLMFDQEATVEQMYSFIFEDKAIN
ncbi:LCP family protein [Clostridium thermarum]|uniref:LCP family protein n=1 Tax=Clostridium thermarum TaxID=1716543 RepID=UPI0013D08138|nr:LCP family protein [Clostridium thermarum]